MTEALAQMVQILDLDRIEVDIFRARSPAESRQRVFGGQVAGQALVAAGRTAPADRAVHSLHAYFLRPGDPSVPIVYLVDRLHDGRSFTTRRVVAVQHGKAIFNLSASFQVDQPSQGHQIAAPTAPPPESLPTVAERFRAKGITDLRIHTQPIDLRYVNEPPWLAPPGQASDRLQVWMRAAGNLPADPLIHVCALTYASDLTLIDAVLLARGLTSTTDAILASLDHAMWFHRPFRADDWLLYDLVSPSSAGSRGLARGEIWTRDGRLVASVVQEGMVRVPGLVGGGATHPAEAPRPYDAPRPGNRPTSPDTARTTEPTT